MTFLFPFRPNSYMPTQRGFLLEERDRLVEMGDENPGLWNNREIPLSEKHATEAVILREMLEENKNFKRTNYPRISFLAHTILAQITRLSFFEDKLEKVFTPTFKPEPPPHVPERIRRKKELPPAEEIVIHVVENQAEETSDSSDVENLKPAFKKLFPETEQVDNQEIAPKKEEGPKVLYGSDDEEDSSQYSDEEVAPVKKQEDPPELPSIDGTEDLSTSFVELFSDPLKKISSGDKKATDKAFSMKYDIVLICDGEEEVEDIKSKLEEKSDLGKIHVIKSKELSKKTVPKAEFLAFHILLNPYKNNTAELFAKHESVSRECKENCIFVALDRSSTNMLKFYEKNIAHSGFVVDDKQEKRWIAISCSLDRTISMVAKSTELIQKMVAIYREFANAQK